MATQLCQKCKQEHPGRACDYDEKGECAETKAEAHVRSAHQILRALQEKIGQYPEIGAAITKLEMALNVLGGGDWWDAVEAGKPSRLLASISGER